MQRLSDKVALVTGAAGSIGQAMIRCLAQEGAPIVATDNDPGDIAAMAAFLALPDADNITG